MTPTDDPLVASYRRLSEGLKLDLSDLEAVTWCCAGETSTGGRICITHERFAEKAKPMSSLTPQGSSLRRFVRFRSAYRPSPLGISPIGLTVTLACSQSLRLPGIVDRPFGPLQT